MPEIIFKNLRMSVSSDANEHLLSLCVESGFMSYEVTISLSEKDVEVIKSNSERASFLQAAFHHPFQLKKSHLSIFEQRQYLDTILHSSKNIVEQFLTKMDHGSANGAVSNMLRITCGRDPEKLRKGQWFDK